MKNSYLVLMATLILASCQSCFMVNYAHFRPIESEPPVMMFETYELDMGSSAPSRYSLKHFSCNVIFRGKIPSGTNFDTIPIFVVDSICFEGACLIGNICVDTTRDSVYQYSGLRSGFLFSAYPRRHEDLPFHMFYINSYSGFEIPMECENQEIFVVTYARLIDRITRNELARESKSTQFQLTKSRSSRFE